MHVAGQVARDPDCMHPCWRSLTIERNMPFEFRVLEGALAGLVHEVGAEISELVDRAVPAMDALIKRASLQRDASPWIVR